MDHILSLIFIEQIGNKRKCKTLHMQLKDERCYNTIYFFKKRLNHWWFFILLSFIHDFAHKLNGLIKNIVKDKDRVDVVQNWCRTWGCTKDIQTQKLKNLKFAKEFKALTSLLGNNMQLSMLLVCSLASRCIFYFNLEEIRIYINDGIDA